MEAFLEYIMLNYTWFLGGAIIILLAIIGYYADETNFGQGKQNIQKGTTQKNDESVNKLDKYDQIQENIEKIDTNEKKEQEPLQEKQIIENIESEQPIILNESKNIESEFEKFEKEFNEILPEKETIDNDLLEEIDNLSFDKTQKIDVSDILDLDDVELPEIKTMEAEEQDIWKF